MWALSRDSSTTGSPDIVLMKLIYTLELRSPSAGRKGDLVKFDFKHAHW